MSNDVSQLKVEANITKPVEKLTDTIVNAANFVGQVIGPSLESAGGVLADQFAHWRAANIERLRLKWIKRRKQMGISEDAIKHLPLDLGIRLFEAASLEGGDEVQELWAALLEAATNPETSINVRRVHVEILRSITAIEAAILTYIRSKTSDHCATLKRYSLDERVLGIQNLRRQQCVRLRLDVVNLKLNIRLVASDFGEIKTVRLTDVIEEIVESIADIGGANDHVYFNTTCGVGDRETWMAEDQFELTELADDLMNLCAARESRE